MRNGYKMTELGEIPEDWNVSRIGEVAKFQGGYAFKSNDYVEEGIRLVKITSVQQNKILWEDTSYLPIDFKNKYKEYLLGLDDVVMAMTRPIISTGIKVSRIKNCDLPALLNQRVGRFIVSNNLYSKYLFYYTFSDYYINKVHEASYATNQPNISSKQVENILIILPPFQEQQKIASILSPLDDYIDQTEKLIEKTKELKKGLMHKLLKKGFRHTEFKMKESGEIPKDWELKTIGEVVKFEGGSQPSKEHFSRYKKDGYIRLIQIRDYKMDEYITYVPEAMCRRFCEEDDVMIGRYGPPIFQILRGIKGAYNVALIKAIPKNGVIKDYLYYYLSIEPLLNLIDRLSQRTSGQTGIDMDALKEYSFPIPPIEEQKKIVTVLKSIESKVDDYESKKQKLQYLKQGLMQKLLTGKIRVKIS